jgi:branched-chain amino acid transport system substrate-binding protein
VCTHRGAMVSAGLLLAILSGAQPAAAQARGILRIATQSPLTGERAALGASLREGAQLAVDRFKSEVEKAGFDVELAPFDDQGRPHVGVANAKTIVADRSVLVVIGHLDSAVALPASEIYREATLGMIAPAGTDPLLTDRGLLTVSRVCGRDDVEGAVAARFATDSLRAKRAYVVHGEHRSEREVAESFARAAKRLGMEVLGVEGIGRGASLAPTLATIGAKGPDLVFFGGEPGPAASLVRQARERGIKAAFLGPRSLDSDALLGLGGDAVVGMHFTTPVGHLDAYPAAKELAEEYRKRFGRDPEGLAALAYDATAVGLKAVLAAIRAKGGAVPSRQAVAEAIRRVVHKGVTGTVEFDAKGDPKKATYLVYQVRAPWKATRLVQRLRVGSEP